jgi:hypothetical protein
VAGPIYRQVYRADDIHFMYGYLACFDAIALGSLTALLTRRFDLAALVAARFSEPMNAALRRRLSPPAT